MNGRHLVAGVSLAVLAAACGGGGERAVATPPAGPRPAPAPEAPKPARPTIVFLGDSLTAGLGLDATKSYPALLQARLTREGYDYEVVNAGVSGDTSAGGLRRLDWVLDRRVRVLVVALGGNDGLRGLAPGELRRNLEAIVERGARAGAVVILAGMEAPPNNGPEYTAAFREVYAEVARARRLPFIPFLLHGVAGDAAMNQGDGIHPNERGAAAVADTVWRTLQPVLAKRGAGTP